MVNKIKRFFFLQKAQKKSANRKKYSGFKVNKLMVILNPNEVVNKKELKNCFFTCFGENLTIDIVSFNDNTVRNKDKKEGILYKSDIGFFGTFSDEVNSMFFKKEYDLCINFYKNSNPYLLGINQLITSKFKISVNNSDLESNDLFIILKELDLIGFKNELLLYLNKLIIN
jgi:hypothetical protein